MADRVAEVENLAQAAFAFVARHHVGFDLARARDEMCKLGYIELLEAVHLAVDALKQAAVADDAVLDGFAKAGAQLALRQAGKRRRVDDDKRRLMKRADEVFTERMIDTGFTADGTVYLCQQGGGHLREAYATLVGRRRKPTDVADHAAAHRDDHIRTLDTLLNQKGVELFRRAERLEAFAVADEKTLDLKSCAPKPTL